MASLRCANNSQPAHHLVSHDQKHGKLKVSKIPQTEGTSGVGASIQQLKYQAVQPEKKRNRRCDWSLILPPLTFGITAGASCFESNENSKQGKLISIVTAKRQVSQTGG